MKEKSAPPRTRGRRLPDALHGAAPPPARRYAGLPWVIVPVRGEATGKSRLAPALDPLARARLNRSLLRRTLAAIAAWQGTLARCIVVSPCGRSRASARRLGARVLAEPRPRAGLNRAVMLAADRACRLGADRVLVLPVDLARIDAHALRRLAALARGRVRAVVAPDTTGSGTNALLVAARPRFPFVFGPDSLQRHLEHMRERGWEVALCDEPRLRFDLDTPAQLAALRECLRFRHARDAMV